MTLLRQPLNLWESVKKLLLAKPARFPFLLFSLIMLATCAQAQRLAVGADKGTNTHVMYLEIGGAGYYYTVNYERILLHKNKFAMFARIGFEYIPFGGADKLIHFPIGANVTFGEKKHRMEAGFAALFRMNFDPGVGFGEGFYLTEPPTRIFLAPSAGYRFHAKPNEWGETFFLRITFTPIIGMDVFDSKPYFLPHAGISIGRTWNNQNRKGR